MKRLKGLWPVLLCAALLALCWLAGVGVSDVVIAGLDKDGLDFYRGGNKSYYLDGGDSYGVINGGPGFTLPAGRYQLRATVVSDGENALNITSSLGVQRVALPANSWTTTLGFELEEDARDVEFQIDFEQGSYLQVHGLDLVMCDRTDGLWTLAALLTALCALYICQRAGRVTRADAGMLVLLCAAVLMACVPALRSQIPGGHDTLFHQMRLYNVADALRSGQFPVRMGGYGYNGYGSAASIFYPDVFLYLPALMMCTGATMHCAIRMYIVAMNALSAWTMYRCGRRMFGSKAAGACASMLYTLAGYRLMDIYLRDALGEYTAMAMMPLFVLGLWEVLFGDKRRWPTLALGAWLVFMSHMLSTVLCAALAAAVCVPCAGKLIREKRLGALLKAALLAALAGMFYLIPMLDYMRQGIGDSGTFLTSCSDTALEAMELFVTGADKHGLGGTLLLGTVALVYAALTGFGERERMRTAVCCAVLGAAAAMMATKLFPWALAERLTRGLVNYLQFPYRLLAFSALFLSLAGGYGAVSLAGENRQAHLAMLLTLALCVTGASGQISGYAAADDAAPSSGLRYADPNIRLKSYTDVIVSSYLEYALPGSDLSATREQDVLLDGDVEMTDYRKDGTTMTAKVHAQQDAQLTLPVFGFDGYRAELDGRALETGLGGNNRLTVRLPGGAQGELRVWFAGKAVWRAAECVSLLALAWLCVCCVKGRRRAA